MPGPVSCRCLFTSGTIRAIVFVADHLQGCSTGWLDRVRRFSGIRLRAIHEGCKQIRVQTEEAEGVFVSGAEWLVILS